MSSSLVIVESPAKARTIRKYLGPEYRVESSIGHIRDLPRSAAEVPKRYKGRSWARLGVDVDGGFDPLYVIPADKRSQITKLRKALAGADELILATDEDREGEAIAWHLKEVLKPKVPVRRMVFHEITKSAVQSALQDTREIDQDLVDAQEARRLLDRLYGYEVSPVLWKKVRPRLSAGRVQSVATRLVVERERERMAFVPADYWTVEAELETEDGRAHRFPARVTGIEGSRVALGGDFDRATGQLKRKGLRLLLETEAKALSEELPATRPEVIEVREKPFTRRPYAPFITSTLQQEAGRKLRFGAQRTMRVAQRLYENGYITYMRTDSNALSGQAIAAARRQVAERYGEEYLPARPRQYRSGSNAQEAHEAIRPAGTSFRTPSQVARELQSDELRLYELIWKRTLASQMKDAKGTTTTVLLATSTPSAESVQLTASGRVLHFDGFLRVYVEGRDDPGGKADDEERFLPAVREGDQVTVPSAEASGHTTQPPARYTEATLVREMERRGIGRPSTYAAILQTIVDRGYVWKKSSALVPSFLAFAVTQLLERHLADLVDPGFTARMESDLDEIAGGRREARPWLRRFYFGDAPGEDTRRGLQSLVREGVNEIDARAVSSLPLGRDDEGREVAVRAGRYGAYVQAGDGDRRVSLEDEVAPDQVTLESALELLAGASGADGPLGHHPETGEPVYVKKGRFGDYFQLGESSPPAKGGKRSAKGPKPKTASVWPTMEVGRLTVDDALLALSFPKELGRHPESGEAVRVQDGPYGPYVRCGKENRSVDGHDRMANLTLEQALALLSQPKGRRGSAASAARELGEHPQSGLALLVKSGRYGPYVTDGRVNASVPKAKDPKTIGLEKAVELLAAREAKLLAQGRDPRAPRKRRPARRRPARKKK